MIYDILNGKKTKTPVWFMRQAGRYMASYRALKEKYDFVTMCLIPEISAEVAIMPVREFGFDAAIFFSDILIPFIKSDIDLKYKPGPVIGKEIKNKNDFNNLKVCEVGDFDFASKAIKILAAELSSDKDLIGFVGSPFTVAYYLLNGDIKRLTDLKDEGLFDEFMQKVTLNILNFAKAQIDGGARIVQIFDTKAYLLPEDDYRIFSLPYAKKLNDEIKKYGAKTIYFFLGGLGLSKAALEVGADCFSVDSSATISEFADVFKNLPLQGNLAPDALLVDKKDIERRIKSIVDEGRNINGHIFNLGHGLLKETTESNVAFAVDLVHRYR
jgi:uroporphyrinogen decarboxylase